MSNERLIVELAEDYLEMQAAKEELRAEVKEKYRKLAKEELDERTEELERPFAVKLVTARKAGVRRYELELPVLRSKDGAKFRHFIELGGGEITAVKTASEKLKEVTAPTVSWQEMKDSLGLVYEGQVEWVTESFNMETLETEIQTATHPTYRMPSGVKFFVKNRQLWTTVTEDWAEIRDFSKDNSAELEVIYREHE